ncbi:MAG: hypothetical protein GYB31_08040 [Bacteroidetes bacterium]|nr:hypothetical protein [Bacteroidota bacterium]
MASHFDEFTPSTKSDWLDKVIRDLKGKSLAELDHQWTEKIRLSPFFHREDVDERAPLSSGSSGSWQIGSMIRVEEEVSANKVLLDELLHGVNAPRLLLTESLSAKAWENLLKEVEPAWISLEVYPGFQEAEPAVWVDPFIAALLKKGVDLNKVTGALRIGEEAVESLLKNHQIFQDRLPNMRLFYIDNSGNYRPDNPEEELALAAYMAFYRMQQAIDSGMSLQEAHANLQVVLSVGNSFFKSLAKLRAFRLLWANLLQAAGMDSIVEPPFVSVQFAPESQDDDQHTNMIRATTMAMSAVLGGANRLEVLPANATKEAPTAFTRRVARNLQHILSMEAHLDQVLDPAAGSYFLEQLTNKLAEAAFDIFKGMKKPF